jgi:formylmethanofuran dehydrogenase subunit C
MIAGTLVICGTVSAWPGYMLRRGTLILGHQPSVISPTLAHSGNVELVFADLLARSLQDWARPAAQLLRQPLQRLVGDLSVAGKGEIFLPR